MKDRNVAKNVAQMKGNQKFTRTGGEVYYILRGCRAMPVAGCLGVHDAGKQSCAGQVGELHATSRNCPIRFTQNFPNSMCDWLTVLVAPRASVGEKAHVHSTRPAVTRQQYISIPPGYCMTGPWRTKMASHSSAPNASLPHLLHSRTRTHQSLIYSIGPTGVTAVSESFETSTEHPGLTDPPGSRYAPLLRLISRCQCRNPKSK